MTTTLSAVGAVSHYEMNWLNIDWGKAHRIVRRLSAYCKGSKRRPLE